MEGIPARRDVDEPAHSGPRHVLQVFQPATGGVPAYVVNLVRGLLERGWRVSVAGPPDATATAQMAACGATVVPMRLARSPRPWQDGRAVAALAGYARAEGVEILHAHSTKAGLVGGGAARVTRTPSVYTPHAWAFDMEGARLLRSGYASFERALSRSWRTAVVTVSDAERRAARKWNVCADDMIEVIPTGLPPAPPPATRSDARAALGLDAGAVVVAWVGRLGAQKRPEQLAALAGALEGDALVVALGDGLAGSDPGDGLLAAGGRIAEAGTPPALLYAAADVLVHTARWEGLPIALLEAMQAGLPVVAYGVGGITEQVCHGKTGYLAPSGDLDTLAAHLREVVHDAALREAMGSAGKAYAAERFGYESMLDQVERTYATAASHSPGSRR
jgi:glycosyltransferase involved in cell wall biosynthesis